MIKLEPQHIEHFIETFNGTIFHPTSHMKNARAVANKLGMKYDRELVRWISDIDLTAQFNELLSQVEFEEPDSFILFKDYKIKQNGISYVKNTLNDTFISYISYLTNFIDNSPLAELEEHIKTLIDKKSYSIVIEDDIITKQDHESQWNCTTNCYPMGLSGVIRFLVEERIDWKPYTEVEFNAHIKEICEEIKAKVVIK